MNFSTSVKTGRVFAGAKLTIKKPSAIAAKMLSKFKKSAQPVHKKRLPNANESMRPSSFIMFFIMNIKSAPKAQPSKIEPKMSRPIIKSCAPSETDAPFKSGDEIEFAIAYKISATASSIATMP